MNTPYYDDPDETEAIHYWFELSYANYLVLNRSLLQSMDPQWQRDFTRLLEQLRETYAGLEQPHGYRVHCVDSSGRFIKDPIPHYSRGRTKVAPCPEK